MSRDEMTSKERWLAVLNREPVDRVITDYQATPEASAKLREYLGCATLDEVYERLHIYGKVTVEGKYVGPEPPEGQDIWGCRHEYVDYGTGKYLECVYHPLGEFASVEEIERNYTWPEPDWWDYTDLPQQLRSHQHQAIRGGLC